MSSPNVYISGCHSDPDPSPGLGIARSLRDAFPNIQLTGVDYSIRSSGLHSSTFDRAWVQPVWGEVDLDTYAREIREILSCDSACWLSGLDVEIDWLAAAVADQPRLLIPSAESQAWVRKPKLAAAEQLAMGVPQTLPATATPAELHRLGRRAGWRVWVKGMYHEAYSALSFQDIGFQIDRLRRHWPIEQIFVQRHVDGLEQAYTFAAFQGRLLGLVQVEKRAVTGQGKTWAARVVEPEAAVWARVEAFVAAVAWTGGGEIEFIRAANGMEWLLDFNPRFPAYIYGVTLCGVNLPAQLVAASLGLVCPETNRRTRQFIRVVQEIAVRDDFQLPPLNSGGIGGAVVGKHPSFQPELVRRMTSGLTFLRLGAAPISESQDYVKRSESLPPHPHRIRDWSIAESIFDQVAEAIGRCDGLPKIVPAMSIKTDPEHELATRAFRRGWMAEVISPEEMLWAKRVGFPTSQIVFNGPLTAFSPGGRREPLAAVFADSTDALEQLAGSCVARVVGLRLRLPSVPSRFGIDVAEYPDFVRVLQILRSHRTILPYGIHFHVPCDSHGPDRWQDLADEALSWTVVIANALGRPPAVLDLGGGWHPEDFRDVFLPSLSSLHARIGGQFPELEQLIFEPGKAIAVPTGSFRATILEVRQRTESPEAIDVVINLSIADLPMAAMYAHPMTLLRDGCSVGHVRGGVGRVLGKICMENDVLARGVSFPIRPQPGDMLLIHDTGGYDSSMAWPFGRGGQF